MIKKGSLYFDNLDSIRFIAATMVFLGHGFSSSFKYLHIEGTFLKRVLDIVCNGGTGVSIFFVLSGFLITYLLISEFDLNSKIDVKKFYMRRVLRIWPLYFAVVFFSFIIYPLLKTIIGVNNPLGSNIWYHLSFLSNFDVIHIQKLTPGNDAMSQNITWSVSIEEQFYLLWPLLFAFTPKKTWVYLITGVILASVAYRIFYYTDEVVLYFHSFSVMLDLGIGGLFAYLIKRYQKISSFFEKSSTKLHLLLFCIPVCLLFWHDLLFSFKYGGAISRFFISLSFALIISAQAMTKTNSVLSLKNLSFANKWGKYTYGIYLLHPIVITLMSILLKAIHFPDANFMALFTIGVINFILTLLASKLSYKYFESWFLRKKDKFAIIKTHN